MAKFAKDDWVKIIPSPDTRSDVWTANHNKFCDKIGQIIDINDLDDSMILFRVSVHFDYKQTSLYGAHSAWFEDKHVVKSSKWENDRVVFLNKEYEAYVRTEANLKKKRDEMLREIFSDPYQQELKKKKLKEAKDAINAIKEIEEKRDMDGWIYGDGWFVKDFDDI